MSASSGALRSTVGLHDETATPSGWRDRVRMFFFADEMPYGLALMRVLLPLILLTIVVPRWSSSRELFSADGAPAQLGLGYGYTQFVPELSGEAIVALCTLLVFSLLSASLGWKTRWSLGLSASIYTYLCLVDAVSTLTKFSVIATHLLVLMMMSRCDAVWSIDAWLARRAGKPLDPVGPAWPRRLVQFLIASTYFGAAITKIHTPSFFTGDQIQFWMLTHVNYSHYMGEVLSMYPVLIIVMAYVVIVWETVFLFTAWRTVARWIVLPLGVLFHTMTLLTLGLFIFPAVCFCAYLSFFDDHDAQAIGAAWKTARRRWRSLRIRLLLASEYLDAKLPRISPRLSAAWFAGLAAAVSGLGVAAERAIDPYGRNRPEGMHELQPLSDEEVARLLSPPPPLRDSDKFFAVDTGTFLIGGALADYRTTFRPGDAMLVQCQLAPPHEDMWIECHIVDADGAVIDRLRGAAPRDLMRMNFQYRFCTSTVPGEYTLVVKTGGREVRRKSITIAPRSGAPANCATQASRS